jgi:hypothetical protein
MQCFGAAEALAIVASREGDVWYHSCRPRRPLPGRVVRSDGPGRRLGGEVCGPQPDEGPTLLPTSPDRPTGPIRTEDFAPCHVAPTAYAPHGCRSASAITQPRFSCTRHPERTVCR